MNKTITIGLILLMISLVGCKEHIDMSNIQDFSIDNSTFLTKHQNSIIISCDSFVDNTTIIFESYDNEVEYKLKDLCEEADN